MTVCFNENIYIKTFDEYGYYPLKLRKCKDFDGPNNFSILWNQLLILLDNDLIKDEITLCEKFNSKIILEYKNDILNKIDSILYKFIKLKLNNIKLYNSYTIDNSKDIIIKLMELYRIIYNLL